MAEQGRIDRAGSHEIDAVEVAEIAQCALGGLTEENALLRASLEGLRARLAELERLADCDTVTPLPNRRRFIRELGQVVSRANAQGIEAAMLYIDIDGLKTVNDRHGRVVGDAALNHVASVLSGLIRASDFAARVGGDEFALILDRLDHNSAIETADRIARCIADSPFEIEGAPVRIEATIGTTSIMKGDTVDGVMHRADRNTYRARNGD